MKKRKIIKHRIIQKDLRVNYTCFKAEYDITYSDGSKDTYQTEIEEERYSLIRCFAQIEEIVKGVNWYH